VSERSTPQQQNSNDIRRAIEQYAANSSLRKLVAAGCEESQLISGLAALQPSRGFDESWSGLIGQAWPGSRGDLKKKFQSSIRQIRECAVEIKRLESTNLFALLFPPGSPHTLFLTARALEHYADRLSEAIDQVGPKKHPLRSLAKALLVAHVKGATGNWHDQHVSALIAAVTGNSYETHTHLQWRRANDTLIRLAMVVRQTNRPKSRQLT